MNRPTNIPLFEAKTVNAAEVIEPALLRVAASHYYVLGPEVSAFEDEFATYNGVDHCVSVANGTDALELALRAAGVTAGSTVALVANAGFYGSTAVHAIGARPLYVDVSAHSLTMNPSRLEAAFALNPAAVIFTHLYGQLGDIETTANLCRAAGIPLIEDCAQAHGARRNGLKAGSYGDFGCFSFYPTKNLGAIGDGGAVITRSSEHATTLRTLRQYGWSDKYVVSTAGGCNSRLDELQAAVLRAKLPLLDEHNQLRRQIAMRYNDAFADLPLALPVSVGEDYVAHLYVVRTPQRNALQNHLSARHVASSVHFPVPDHLQAAYPHAQVAGELGITEQACLEVLTLPCYPGLGEEAQNVVIEAVRAFFH